MASCHLIRGVPHNAGMNRLCSACNAEPQGGAVRLLKLLFTASVCIWACFFAVLAGAHPRVDVPAGIQPEPLDLAAIDRPTPFLAHMQVLRESDWPGADLPMADPLAVWDGSGWRDLTDADLHPHFESEVWWLRASVENPSANTLTRWLVVEPWRLHDARFFVLGQGETRTVQGTAVAGRRVPVGQRPVNDIDSVFPLTLAPGQKVDLLLRLEDAPIAFLHLEWTLPEWRKDQLQQDAMWSSALLGAVTVLALFLLLQRDRRYLILSLWLLWYTAFLVLYNGHPYRYWLAGWLDHAYTLNFVAGFLSLVAFAWASHVLFGSARQTGWRFWYVAAPLSVLGLALWLPQSSAADARFWALCIALALYLAWPWSIWARIHEHRARQALVLGLFALNWFLELMVLMVILGRFLPWTPEDVYQPILWFKLLSFLLLFARYARLQTRSDERLERILRQAEHQHREQLTQRVQERTRELSEALWLVDRIGQARNDFIVRSAHDLKSPLTSIMGYAQMMEVDESMRPKGTQSIRRTAQRMLELINEMLGMARGEGRFPVRLQPVEPGAFFQEIGDEIRPLVEAGHNQWTLQLADGLPTEMRTDPALLRRALVNLLGNAAQSVSQGRVALCVDWEPPAKHGAQGSWRMVVQDTGPGLPEAVRLRHFPDNAVDAQQPTLPDLESTHEPPTEGQTAKGWGLSNVRMMLEQLGGSVSYQSQAPWGSRFILALPMMGPQKDKVLSQRTREEPPGGAEFFDRLTPSQAANLLHLTNMGARTDLLCQIDRLLADPDAPLELLHTLRRLAEAGDFAGLERVLGPMRGFYK